MAAKKKWAGANAILHNALVSQNLKVRVGIFLSRMIYGATKIAKLVYTYDNDGLW